MLAYNIMHVGQKIIYVRHNFQTMDGHVVQFVNIQLPVRRQMVDVWVPVLIAGM